MSRLTTIGLRVAPSAEASLDMSPGTTAWVAGEWVPFIASTVADDTALAGVVIHDGTGWANAQVEAEFGLGPDGSEVPIGHIRLHLNNSGNGGPTAYLVLHPISGISPGTRVSLRLWSNATGVVTWPCAILYYEDLDSDQAIPYTLATLTSFPAHANSTLITPSATPWDDSGWFVFDPAVGEPAYICGMAMENPADATDGEIDVGIGADPFEAALTTMRFGSYGDGRINFVNLPGLMPIGVNTRLVGRLRKNGTGTETMAVAFLGYRGLIPVAGEGVIGPLLWITLSLRPPVV